MTRPATRDEFVAILRGISGHRAAAIAAGHDLEAEADMLDIDALLDAWPPSTP